MIQDAYMTLKRQKLDGQFDQSKSPNGIFNATHVYVNGYTGFRECYSATYSLIPM